SPQQNCTKQKRGGFPVVNFTSNTYQMKREILSFSNKISKHLSKPDKKFSADMTYGTASKKDIYLVLVYGITEHPMMLATNKKIKSKEDVVNIALTYFSRWRIEEYFRCKKQMFQFENFRVRKLAAINALNFYITLCMAFPAHMSMKSETHALKAAIIQKADPIKEKVQFSYYRLAKGISGILSYAKEGIRLWFRTKRPSYR
ncbi:MAG: transposase, partial [Lachnospiraceae bacterium]|nr:transposase [Lachnospiraceae bacterium]